MTKLTIFILSTAGLSWVLVKSRLFKSFREYITCKYRDSTNHFGSLNVIGYCKYKFLWCVNEVFNCIGCIGFWSGLINYLLIYGLGMDCSILAFGFMGSMVSLIVVSLYEFLNKR